MFQLLLFTSALFVTNLYTTTGFILVRPAVDYGYDESAPEIASFYRKFGRTHGLYGTPVNYIFVREMRPKIVPVESKPGYGPQRAYLSKPKVEYTVITRIVQELRVPMPARRNKWDSRFIEYHKPDRKENNYVRKYRQPEEKYFHRPYEYRELVRY
ncbi:hypothetical protein D915_004882 [Fasciola hepatica]|uniref:Uncharacterized protein n=1 Tax=Fasciola hepatica TaxID=6192 RepID=A0A4E0R9K0_FASHE|nr:hypothetical protein D915_004882 [Fasciola hepatica]